MYYVGVYPAQYNLGKGKQAGNIVISVTHVTHHGWDLAQQAGNIVTCISVTHVTHHGRDLAQQAGNIVASVTHVTHHGRDLNIAQRMLPSYRILPTLYTHFVHVCGLHTQACKRMLPMLPSIIGCYRCYPLCMWSTHTGLHIYVTNVTQCYRMLPMLPTLYVVYTHRPAYICYQCYPVLSDVTDVTHFVCGLHTQACVRMLPTLYPVSITLGNIGQD